MQPAEKKPEVVYRKGDVRMPPPEAAVVADLAKRAFLRAITPLVIGFLLLLGLISVLGWRSANQMEQVGTNASIRITRYFQLQNRLVELRLKVAQLDNEIRIRNTATSQKGLKPPFPFKIDTAREDLMAAIAVLDEHQVFQDPQWTQLRTRLDEYVKLSEDLELYSVRGRDLFGFVLEDIAQLFLQLQTEQAKVNKDVIDSQTNARRSILLWSLLALGAGALVAAGTIWQVQRHFWQMRSSMLEARRERIFTTQLLEGMVSAVAAIDEEDRIRSANAAFFRIFPGASIGASVLERFAPDDAMRLLDIVTAIRVAKATYHGRHVTQVEGEDKAFDVYSSPLAIDGNRGQIVTLVDATEAAESERTLRRSESLAAVGQATTQVAHEIRNPLGSIRLGVSMLRDSVNDQEALNTIELVERGIKHLNKLVVDVTQFSRQKELDRSAVDLHESLERSIDLVSDKILEKNANVEKLFARRAIIGQWDAYQLRQVFVNVIANAIDASEENATVRISTELLNVDGDGNGQPRKPYARIRIADEGKGMDRPTRDRIFEPFYSTKKRGTGLGLAIVKQIVEQHGGRISVVSEPGKGA
ncbi:MAG TPA: ATP-binding protein, partial [Pyrinomonadaceae bacterium]|nr:ATP-binding protein [Pyrinomonadaceae bacterium]